MQHHVRLQTQPRTLSRAQGLQLPPAETAQQLQPLRPRKPAAAAVVMVVVVVVAAPARGIPRCG